MPFIEVEKPGRGVNLEKKNESRFGRARFKMLMRNPKRGVKRAADDTNLQFREEV